MDYNKIAILSGFLNPMNDQGPVIVKTNTFANIQSENANRLCQLFFQGREEVALTREDVIKSRRLGTEMFLLSVLFWGYPTNQRGRGTAAFDHWNLLVALVDTFCRHKDMTFEEFQTHFNEMDAIKGLGISTFSKILYFLGATIDGHRCLILDAMVARGIQNLEGEEFFPVREALSGQRYTFYRNYPLYLRFIHDLAIQNNIPADNIEYILWLAGRKNV